MVKFDFDFKSHIKKYILKNKLFKKNHNSIYDLDYILDVIEYIFCACSLWFLLSISKRFLSRSVNSDESFRDRKYWVIYVRKQSKR